MPHFPKPFFKKPHHNWYVEIDRRQICLSPNHDAAIRQHHQLMQAPPPKPQASQNPLVVELADSFLDWVQKERAPDTFEWNRYRPQRFWERYPALKTTDLRPFHVQQWVDAYLALSRSSRRNYVSYGMPAMGDQAGGRRQESDRPHASSQCRAS